MAIPRVFHFLFGLNEQTAPFHLAHYLCLRSCLHVNRPEAVRFHCLHEPYGPLWDAIKPEIEVCPVTDSDLTGIPPTPQNNLLPYRYAHVSDFVRLTILQREGGVYADIDTLFIAPYPDSIFHTPEGFVMGRERLDRQAAGSAAGGSLCNAVILAEPGAAFGGLWLKHMAEAFDGSWSNHSTFLPYRLSRQHPELVRVEPESSFFHLDWTPDGIARIFERDEVLPPTVYSLHLWAHLWWSPARQDVSRFSHARLTPAYVAHARTTYARYTRHLLPPGLDCGNAVQWRAAEALRSAVDASRSAARRLRRYLPSRSRTAS